MTKVQVNCDVCDKPCLKDKSHARQQQLGKSKAFCSEECKKEYRNRLNPCEEYTCGECGKKFMKRKSDFRGKYTLNGHRFCSKKCSGIYVGRLRRGDKHPNWNPNKIPVSKRIKMRMIKYLGEAKCANCGCDIIDILEINHIKGGGNAERKKYNNREEFFRAILHGKLNKEDYNILCRVCNAQYYVETTKGVKGHEITWNWGFDSLSRLHIPKHLNIMIHIYFIPANRLCSSTR